MSDIIERLKPQDRAEWRALRKNDITASVIGGVVSVHPYVTPYQLWATKTGKLVPDDDLDSPAMKRGRLLESVAATCAREAMPDALLVDNNGTGAAPHYWRMPDARIGATPDLLATDKRGFGVIQLKSIEPFIYRQTWHEGEPPLWVALQALTEAKLVGATWAAVGALRVGHAADFDLTDIPLHAGAWQALQDAVGAFWRSVEADTPPEPDFKRDGEIISALHRQSEATSVDLSGDADFVAAISNRKRLKAEIKERDEECKELEAMIRHRAGEHEIITAGGFKVTLRTTHYKGYTVAERTARPMIVKDIRKETT